MKLEKKAYKAIFPELFAYSDKGLLFENQYEIIYGENCKQARIERCLYDNFISFWEAKKSIRTRRFPEEDLYSQAKSSLLDKLTSQQISHLTHSLGVEIGERCPKEFCRAYSVFSSKHSDCEKLVKQGLMSNHNKFGDEVYCVTELGKEAVKTLLLVTKNKESWKDQI